MKDQFVIACIDRPEDATTVLPWARHFAERLNHKGLMMLHVAPQKGDDRWLEQLEVPFASLVGDWRTALDGLPTAFNGILAVVAYDPAAPRSALAHPSTLLREFRGCKIAYLCIPTHNSEFRIQNSEFKIQNAALSLTHQREGKEKMVWASYLARFLGSRIQLAHPAYRDAGLRQRCNNNLRFADKVFLPLGLEYTTVPIDSTTQVDLALVAELAPDLIIAMTTDPREQDIFDHFQPRPELKLLKKYPHQPVLFLNPRDDLYILCD